MKSSKAHTAVHFATTLQVIEGCSTPALVGRGRKVHALRGEAADRTSCGRGQARRVSPGAVHATALGCKVCACCLFGEDRAPWDATFEPDLLQELRLAGPS